MTEAGLRRMLRERGWEFSRRTRGSHSIWLHPSGAMMTVPLARHMPDGGRTLANFEASLDRAVRYARNAGDGRVESARAWAPGAPCLTRQ